MTDYARELDAMIDAYGLRPMVDRLDHEDEIRDEDIPWSVQNKDSNIYVLWIHLPDDALIGITPGGDSGDSERWLVNFYPNEDAYLSETSGDPLSFGDDLATDHVIAIIDAHLYPEKH